MDTNTIMYDRDKGCPFCGGKVWKLFKAFDSDMACEKCGAVYYSYENTDVREPGSFTGRYEPVSRENLLINAKNESSKDKE